MTVNEERGKSWSDMVDNAEEVMDEGYNAMALLEQLDKDIPHCYGEIRVRVALLIDRQRLELEDETPREDDRRSTSIF